MAVKSTKKDKCVGMCELIGKTIFDITGLYEGSDEVRIVTEDGVYRFLHLQDCCEEVTLSDFVTFDATSIIGGTILSAEEVTNRAPEDAPERYHESFTWTFYTIETSKGGLWMRWLGESNGHYSEEVSLVKESL